MESPNVGSWRKSSYSENGGGECVEVGESADAVLVRDTQARAAGRLVFSPEAWERFTAALK